MRVLLLLVLLFSCYRTPPLQSGETPQDLSVRCLVSQKGPYAKSIRESGAFLGTQESVSGVGLAAQTITNATNRKDAVALGAALALQVEEISFDKEISGILQTQGFKYPQTNLCEIAPPLEYSPEGDLIGDMHLPKEGELLLQPEYFVSPGCSVFYVKMSYATMRGGRSFSGAVTYASSVFHAGGCGDLLSSLSASRYQKLLQQGLEDSLLVVGLLLSEATTGLRYRIQYNNYERSELPSQQNLRGEILREGSERIVIKKSNQATFSIPKEELLGPIK